MSVRRTIGSPAHGSLAVRHAVSAHRPVMCGVRAMLDLVVDAYFCSGSMPAIDEYCTIDAACGDYSWNNGDWTECSATCGPGTRTRDVWCVSPTGQKVSDSDCSFDSSTPSARSSCIMAACDDVTWEVSSWGSCSVSCGLGFKERSVHCLSSVRGYILDSECVALDGKRPEDHRWCDNDCYFYVTGSWGCCVDGEKSRNVYCISSLGEVDTTLEECSDLGSAPSETGSC
jgi:hypothetical protein